MSIMLIDTMYNKMYGEHVPYWKIHGCLSIVRTFDRECLYATYSEVDGWNERAEKHGCRCEFEKNREFQGLDGHVAPSLINTTL